MEFQINKYIIKIHRAEGISIKEDISRLTVYVSKISEIGMSTDNIYKNTNQ